MTLNQKKNSNFAPVEELKQLIANDLMRRCGTMNCFDSSTLKAELFQLI